MSMLWNESDEKTSYAKEEQNSQPSYYEEHLGDFPLKFLNFENGFYQFSYKDDNSVENNFEDLRDSAPKSRNRIAYGVDNLSIWHPHITQLEMYQTLIKNLNKDDMDLVNLIHSTISSDP